MARKSATQAAFLGAIPGIALAAYHLATGHVRAAAAIGITVAVTGALLNVWIHRRVDRRLTALDIEADNVYPRQERELDLPVGTVIAFEASVRALQRFPRLRTLRADAETGRIEARTRMYRDSWGEKITVQISGHGNATVHVQSEPRLDTVTMDFGQDLENVVLFERYLLEELGIGPPATPKEEGQFVDESDRFAL